MARSRQGKQRGPTGQALKSLKHDIAVLKKKGLVSPRIDARKSPSRYMRSKVKALGPVLRGELVPVERSPKIAKEYKKGGSQVIRNRVLLSPEDAARVRRRKDEYITTSYVNKGGGLEERVILPVGVNNISTFLADETRIDQLLGPDRRFAFTFFGNRSLQTFPNASSLFEYINRYDAFKSPDPKANRDGWKNLILYSLKAGPDNALAGHAASWEMEARASSEAARKGRQRRRQGAKVNATGRNSYGGRGPRLTQEEVKRRDTLAKRAARAAKSPELKEAERTRQREYMRRVRGTKKPRK